MKNNRTTIIAALAILSLSACKPNNSPVEPLENNSQEEPTRVVFDNVSDADEPETVPATAVTPKVTVPRNASQPTPTAQAKPTQKANKTTETIYVETDGAQGRVWGHVTMKGDRGTGTIHDWDENTLAVSVTRHGNELFAVDQNSRQYVFKLKN